MNFDENTLTRTRIIQEALYTAAGMPNHTFEMPQPFVANMFEHLRDPLGIDPVGFAKQVNQVFAENLGNSISARVKKAAGTEGVEMPTQEDLNELVQAYDFSASRVSAAAPVTQFEKIFTRNARVFIRRLLKQNGYQEMPAPVIVAAKNAKVTEAGQINYEDFCIEVNRLIEGEGPWVEKNVFIALRDSMVEEARAEEERVRLNELETENKLNELVLD